MMNMTEKARNEVRETVMNALGRLTAEGKLPAEPLPPFTVEQPADSSHGDFSCNAALVSAKTFRRNPRETAGLIAEAAILDGTLFERVEVAGPGFINFFIKPLWFGETVETVLAQGDRYGRTELGQGKRVLVEFVSANPTGPMHIGNARGGAIGDCLASLLDYAGYKTEREFYINDAGNQVGKFGLSLDIRYKQLFGSTEEMPEDSYHGQDIIDHAKAFADIHGDKYMNVSEEERRKALVDYALPINIKALETDLLKYRIKYDTWFRESSLHESGKVAEVIEMLKAKGVTYEQDGALWFRATDFGDDQDRVLVRANGVPTYFVPDIAYHYNKLVTRGFDKAIDILGADHHGYIARMKAAMTALGVDADKLDIVIMQMVRLVRGGETVKLSKRSGKAITLSTLLDEIPMDAARFFFNLRNPDTHFDFDLDLAIKESSENPVFYVQYAHARICRLIEKLAGEGVVLGGVSAEKLTYTDEEELAVIRQLAVLPDTVNDAAKAYDPSKITRYCYDLAQLFHKFYDNCRIMGEEESVVLSRLALCTAVKTVIKNLLDLLKVEAPEKM
ncbi:MAG: arginine--tRNA ligase [Ruminiclostridium sp.]|nr:arginine--tRNA ligase [Ruminiclostridium sp.]